MARGGSRRSTLAGALANPAVAELNRDLLGELAGENVAARVREVREGQAAERSGLGGGKPDSFDPVRRRLLYPRCDPLLAALIPERPRLRVLTDEDAVQQEIVTRFDAGSLDGEWAVLCVQFNNENRVPVPPAREGQGNPAMAAYIARQQRAAWSLAQRLLAMGLVPGFPDLALLWRPGRIGFGECKRPPKADRWAQKAGKLVRVKDYGGTLKPRQRVARDLLEGWGFPYGRWMSWDEAREDAVAWGALSPQ